MGRYPSRKRGERPRPPILCFQRIRRRCRGPSWGRKEQLRTLCGEFGSDMRIAGSGRVGWRLSVDEHNPAALAHAFPVPTQAAMRPRPEPKVQNWVAAQDLDALFLSVVCIGELEAGFTTMHDAARRARLEARLNAALGMGVSSKASPLPA